MELDSSGCHRATGRDYPAGGQYQLSASIQRSQNQQAEIRAAGSVGCKRYGFGDHEGMEVTFNYPV